MFAVNAAFPDAEPSTWPQCERLLIQALAATQIIEGYQIIGEEAGRLLHETASYLRDRARYAEAEPLYRHALQIREQYLGPEHRDVAVSLSGLAIIYGDQARYAEAEPFYRRALQIWEQQPGSEHSEMAMSLNGLANFYQEHGRYAEAEPLYRRALQISERRWGPNHPDVVRLLGNLASLYVSQER